MGLYIPSKRASELSSAASLLRLRRLIGHSCVLQAVGPFPLLATTEGEAFPFRVPDGPLAHVRTKREHRGRPRFLLVPGYRQRRRSSFYGNRSRWSLDGSHAPWSRRHGVRSRPRGSGRPKDGTCRLRRSRATREPEPMHFADNGTARHASELPGNLTCRQPILP